jgi:hypothetical protein
MIFINLSLAEELIIENCFTIFNKVDNWLFCDWI